MKQEQPEPDKPTLSQLLKCYIDVLGRNDIMTSDDCKRLTQAANIIAEVERFAEEAKQWPNDIYSENKWMLGGPWPGVSICVETDPGCAHPDNAEPPIWEPVFILHHASDGVPHKSITDNAKKVITSVNGFRTLIKLLEGER